MNRPQEWRGREEIIGDAQRFLREFEAGERDADPEVVELATVIAAHGDRITGRSALDPEGRKMLRELRNLTRPGHSYTEEENQRARELADTIYEINGTADAVVDVAAEKLAQLVAEPL
jgi:hypothetical protein